MSLEHPAHVGNGVTHGASMGQIALGIGGIAVGAVIAFFCWPEVAGAAAITAAVVGAAGTVSFSTAIGLFIGKQVDKLSAPSVAGHILTGFPTVFLGPGIKQAARADEDTTADCAGEHVGWEGSDTVFLGVRPMSRIGDRLKCQGKICEGIESVSVGGKPSQEGKELEEATNPIVWGITLFGDILGLPGGKTWVAKGVAAVGTYLDATDNPYGEDVGNAQTLHDTIEKGAEHSEEAGSLAAKAVKLFK
jgi:hypothetical protein